MRVSQPWNDLTAATILLRMTGNIHVIEDKGGSIVFYDNQIRMYKDGDLYVMRQNKDNMIIAISFDVKHIVESAVMLVKIS